MVIERGDRQLWLGLVILLREVEVKDTLAVEVTEVAANIEVDEKKGTVDFTDC